MPLKVAAKKYEVGSTPKAKNPLGRDFTEEEKDIFNAWASCDVEFDTKDDFSKALTKAGGDEWASQKVFFSAKYLKGKEKEGEYAADSVKLYSARVEDDAKALYSWAKAKGVTLSGKKLDPVVTPTPDAPFKGHLGDRAHTIKHWRQKTSGGKNAYVLVLKLKKAGVTAMLAAPLASNGGEGYVDGKLGLKKEQNAFSVAISNNKTTWDYLKGILDSIEIIENPTA
jgi:hypothetical protein